MQKGFAPVVFIILALVLITGGVAGYIILSKPKFPVYAPPLPATTSDQTSKVSSDDETANPDSIEANWKTYTLDSLQFKLPDKWKAETSTLKNSDGSSFNLMQIYPKEPEKPGLTPPSFSIKEQSGNLGKELDLVVSNYENYQEKILNVNNIEMKVLDGLTKPGYFETRSVKTALFQNGDNVFIFSEYYPAEKERVYFDQILSTFKFLD